MATWSTFFDRIKLSSNSGKQTCVDIEESGVFNTFVQSKFLKSVHIGRNKFSFW